MRHGRLVAALALALWLLAADGARALDFAPCAATPDYECASLPVALDPADPASGTLALHVRRLIETREAPEAIVALAGGPGQSSTRFIDDFADVLAQGLEDRQLVVVDQRGTGDSEALTCPALDAVPAATISAEALGDRVERCGEQLGDRRRLFTTTEVVEDLDQVRRGLGLRRISLFGVSYGAYVAQRYARRHPDNVDRLVLDSPVAQDQGGPFDRSSYAAVSRVLRELCGAGRCRQITDDPVADLRRLAARLRRGPITGTVADRRGRRRTQRLAGEAALFDLLVSSDFSPYLRAALPAAIAGAVRGDVAPLLRLVALDEGSGDPSAFDPGNEDAREFSNALFFATTCAEKPLPWGAPTTPLDERPRLLRQALGRLPERSFFPFGPGAVASTQIGTAACARWPVTAPRPVPAPGPIQAPVLVLSGAADLRTPAAEAERVATFFPDPAVVVVPGEAHAVVSRRRGCVQEALRRFFRESAVGDPCAGLRVRPPAAGLAPLAPQDLRRVRPAGTAGRPGRLLQAAVATVRDAARVVAVQGVLDAPIAFGGLRGGSVCARPGDADRSGRRSAVMTLSGVSYVPSVRITGTATLRERRMTGAQLTVRGADDGRLTLRGRRLRGRLGGRAIDLRLPAGAVAVAPVTVPRGLAAGPTGCRAARAA